jgi:hypothetical protein
VAAIIKRKRPRVGDVVEIETPMGLAYAQATHKHAEFGFLLRVAPGTYSRRPEDFSDLVRLEARFLLFFPLGPACHRNIVRLVAEEAIPGAYQVFPRFRAAGARSKEGRVLNWFLWDGDREWPADIPSDELAKYPIRSIWNDTLLIERICSRWRSSDDI